jgi:hypothetical protein
MNGPPTDNPPRPCAETHQHTQTPKQGPAAVARPSSCTRLSASPSPVESGSADRKGFLQGLAGMGLAVAALGTTAAPAQAASLSKVNSELASYGLPPILDVPSGFSPLVEVYGKTAGAKKERGTFLVQVGVGEKGGGGGGFCLLRRGT